MPRTRASPALSSLHRMSGEYTNAVSICEYFTPLRGLCRPSVNTSGCLLPGPRGAAWALPGRSPRPQLPCLLRPVASSHHIPASHHILILHMGPFPRNLTSAGMELPAHALLPPPPSSPAGREPPESTSWPGGGTCTQLAAHTPVRASSTAPRPGSFQTHQQILPKSSNQEIL